MTTPLESALAEAEARFARAATTSPRWRAAYPARVRQALAEWGLTVTGWLPGGAGEPVLAVDRGGVPAVLKVSGDPRLRHQVAAMEAAPAAYARVLARADDGMAYLTERLGDDLWAATTDPEEQCGVIGTLLPAAWEAPAARAYELERGKAAQLAGYVETLGARYGAPYPAALREAAALAAHLAVRERPEVVCHGDPHPGNVLRRGQGWAFVDPDGWRGERAYDLGVALRDHCREITVREEAAPGSGATILRACAERLGNLTGVDAERITQWGFLERVTTGLFLHHLGYPEEGRTFLTTAEILARR